jgi:hypothetical protein
MTWVIIVLSSLILNWRAKKMARRKIEMIEVSEILYRLNKGMFKRQICRSLGVSRNTIRQIEKQAEGLGFKKGISGDEDIAEISKKIMEARKNKPKNPNGIQMLLSKRHKQIEAWLEQPYMTIIQVMRLLAENGQIVSETSLRRYINNNFIKACNSTVHLETKPAKQAQVDYGYVGMMLDPVLNKLRRTYAFIMTLSHSRHRFVYFVFKQDVASWIDCHIRAFNFFGGVPETILLDNLKAGVIKPDIYDPTINRAYAELERHYGFIADPAKVKTPEHKGKVERSVIIVKQQIIAGRDHKDIQAANEYAINWCRNEIAHRITSTTGETPWVRYIRDEKDLLIKLPNKEFECPIWQEGLVHKDHHIVFKGSFYSVPTKYISESVWIKATLRLIEVYHKEKLIKTHIRSKQKGKWITDPKDYPERVNKFLEQTPKACLDVAKAMGDDIYLVIEKVLSKASITNQRKAQAILRLADKYGIDRLNSACKRAIKHDNLKYDCINKILELELDKEANPIKKAISNVGAYLRDASEFATEVCYG